MAAPTEPATCLSLWTQDSISSTDAESRIPVIRIAIGGRPAVSGDGCDDRGEVVQFARLEVGAEDFGQFGGRLPHRALVSWQAVGLLERGQRRLLTLEQPRLGGEEGVTALSYFVEPGTVDIAVVATVVRGTPQPFLDLRRRRIDQEDRSQRRNDRLPVAEGKRVGDGPAVRGEHLYRVAADLDQDAAVDGEFGAEVLDLGSDRFGQLRCLDQVGIRSGDEGAGEKRP